MLCTKCPNEADHLYPEPLCTTHWEEWWARQDNDTNSEDEQSELERWTKDGLHN